MGKKESKDDTEKVAITMSLWHDKQLQVFSIIVH
jgi:hypothetical protein